MSFIILYYFYLRGDPTLKIHYIYVNFIINVNLAGLSSMIAQSATQDKDLPFIIVNQNE